MYIAVLAQCNLTHRICLQHPIPLRWGILVLGACNTNGVGNRVIGESSPVTLPLPAPLAEVICTWSGQLPPKRHKNPTYSPRVFLGGVPWDITEASLIASFRPFGNLSVDWPGKEGKHNRHPPKGENGLVCGEGGGGGIPWCRTGG